MLYQHGRAHSNAVATLSTSTPRVVVKPSQPYFALGCSLQREKKKKENRKSKTGHDISTVLFTPAADQE